MALTMFDRARFTGKGREAEIFRDWLAARLDDAALREEGPGGEGGIEEEGATPDGEP
jgi:hypothetical protein